MKSLAPHHSLWAGSTLKEFWVIFQQLYRVTRQITGVLLFTILAAGCSVSPPTQVEMPLPQNEREAKIQQLSQFSIDASISVKAPSDSVTGSLQWQQQGEHYRAAMSSVIGLSIFELETTATGARVIADGKTHYGENAAELLNYLSGWSLPIEDMPLWIRGLPSHNSQHLQRDSLGRLQSFTLIDSQQRQWQVTYTDFFADSLSLPRKITLQSADSRLKLVIREWTL